MNWVRTVAGILASERVIQESSNFGVSVYQKTDKGEYKYTPQANTLYFNYLKYYMNVLKKAERALNPPAFLEENISE